MQEIANPCNGWGTMPTETNSTEGDSMAVDDALLMELEGDVPSLANQAATELDNIILGRGDQVAAIRRLALLLRSELTAPGTPTTRRMPVKATTLVVMNRAMSEANIGAPAKNVGDVVEQVGQVVDLLEKVATGPAKFKQDNPGEAERLRSFCLAYSRSTSASQRTRDDRPRHPFRR